MHSTFELVAERRGTQTVVSTLRGGGHFAGRLTGQGPVSTVHLIGTAAGPLGGDQAIITITVKTGARLQVRSAAATIIQPNRHRPDSLIQITAHVEDGGRLDLGLEPTVVCANAVHQAELLVTLSGGGQATLAEDVVLGRSGEPGGDWSGRTVLTRDGQPILAHRVRSAILGPDVRAVATRITSDGETLPRVRGTAVLMPLAAGGTLATALGPSLSVAHANLAEVQRRPAPVG